MISSKRFRRLALQWGPFALLGLLLAVLVPLDHWLKQGDIAGYRAPDAVWQIEASDLPQVWERWDSLAAWETLQEKAPPFMQEGAVALRKLTGIRPTPGRLGLWLGPGAVVAGNREHWSVSFRPGIALRLASSVHGILGIGPTPGIRRWGSLYYGWRGGCLLVAPSSDYLSELLERGEEIPHGAVADDGIKLSWTGDVAGSLEIRAQEDLPITLDIPIFTNPTSGLLRYTKTWPEAMVVWNDQNGGLSAQLADVAELLGASIVSEENVALWREMVSTWWTAQSPVPSLDGCGGEGVWMYPAPEGRQADTAIRIGRLMHGCDGATLGAVADLDSARPYQWDDRSGWLVLSSHHQTSWSAIQQGDLVAWSNDTETVPALIEGTPGEGRSGALYLRLRWMPAMKQLRTVLQSLAADRLIPGFGVENVEEDWLPYIDALGGWNYFIVTGESQEGRLRLQGRLAAESLNG